MHYVQRACSYAQRENTANDVSIREKRICDCASYDILHSFFHRSGRFETSFNNTIAHKSLREIWLRLPLVINPQEEKMRSDAAKDAFIPRYVLANFDKLGNNLW